MAHLTADYAYVIAFPFSINTQSITQRPHRPAGWELKRRRPWFGKGADILEAHYDKDF
ncbi:hypothetical protein [Mesorhizobium sp. M0138]|uniref:hypothetical protein n=1 Tax=Mesorhizobium sp. M0138 TaxID=2956891 RepID=UPI0033393203